MAEHDPVLVEKAAEAIARADGYMTDGEARSCARAALAAVAPAIREATVPLIRRAVLDPGSFVDRGPDYEGNARGERIDHWQNRAIHAALRDMAGQQREEQADG